MDGTVRSILGASVALFDDYEHVTVDEERHTDEPVSIGTSRRRALSTTRSSPSGYHDNEEGERGAKFAEPDTGSRRR